MKNKSARSLLKMMGPVLFAGATFVLSIILQQFEVARVFGLFAFGQVVIASMMGISNGFFGTPLVVQLGAAKTDVPSILSSFFKFNLAYCVVSSLLVFLLLRLSDADDKEASMVAALNFFMCFRWYLRSVAVALNKQNSASASDSFYGVIAILMATLLVIFWPQSVVLPAIIAIQLIATLFSLIVFWESLREHIRLLEIGKLGIYWQSFVEQGRWAVLAVLGMQLSANSYAYIVTLHLGAAAFAPLALAALAFRPLGVILTGLVQFERPKMVHSINSKREDLLCRDVNWVRNIVATFWLLNSLVIAAIFIYFPFILIKDGYDSASLQIALLLVAAVVCARGMREPTTAALQAAGEFRHLAKITWSCALLTLGAVVVILVVIPDRPELVLIGVLFAEIVNLALVRSAFMTLRLTLKSNS